MSGLEPELVAILGAVALLAGLIDAIAGGGGLLTVPALMVAGFDPVQAIATNKLQGTFGTASATFAFARARLIEWRSIWPLALIAAAGSVVGALGVQFLSRPVLEAVVPVLLVSVALYFALSRKVQDRDAKARMPRAAFALLVPPVVGLYDGIFGPGAGSFYMLAFVTLLGFGVVRATAHTKLLNFSSNAASLGLYIALGAVVWPVGLVMAGASLVGAQIGSKLALRLGSRLIRPLLVMVCCALAVRLLLDPANPWRRALAGLF
jgi:uncharacterized membrane protein YfcA